MNRSHLLRLMIVVMVGVIIMIQAAEAFPDTPSGEPFDKSGILQSIDTRIIDIKAMIKRLELQMDQEEIKIEKSISRLETEIESQALQLQGIQKRMSHHLRNETDIPLYLQMSQHLHDSIEYVGNLEETTSSYFMTIRMAVIFAIHLEISQAQVHLEELEEFKENILTVRTIKEAEGFLENMPHFYPAEALYGKPQIQLKNPTTKMHEYILTGQQWLERKPIEATN